MKDSFQEELLGMMAFYEVGASVLDGLQAIIQEYHEKRPANLTARETRMIAALEILSAYGHQVACKVLRDVHRAVVPTPKKKPRKR